MKSSERPVVRPDVGELSLLLEVSQILDHALDLRDVVEPVLDAVVGGQEAVRGVLMLLNRETGEIAIEAARGLSRDERARGRYRLGEGITGRVVESGEAAVVPRIGEDPRYLHRTGAPAKVKEKDVSFVCVPIKQGNQTLGALGVYREYEAARDLEDDRRQLAVVGSMIAQAVGLRQAAQEAQQRLEEENRRLNEELKDRFKPDNIIGRSKAMQGVYDMIWRVSRSDATVLLLGESGSGKELVAHAIHYNSLRAGKPFIKVNCAALPETVIESELFGHERGAFTGAVARRQGRFEAAHGGTIFLDEIGDLSPNVQVKLLRVLQEKEFERLGGNTPIKTNVRVIAATNHDLEKRLAEGSFRADLYYRLNIFPIHVPPLRDRRSDILLLADHFVEKFSAANGKPIRRISTPAIDMLMAYHWPGNVRELENCIERAVLLSTDGVIHGHHLPPTLQTAEASGTRYHGRLQDAMDALERELVLDALKSARGNMASAARELGVTERQMGLRVGKYGISPRRFRSG